MDKLINKPHFKEGTLVRVDLGDGIMGTGKIRGKATSNLIDLWIVETVDMSIDKSTYEWTCFTVPHTLMEKIEEHQ